MRFDCNAYLGHWFARQIRHNTAPELLSFLDRYEIDRAVVGSLSAVMYRNSQMGNEELAAEIEDHRDRLWPFGVINPNYMGWERDLDWCVEELGAKGIRLYPQYHDYEVGDEICKAACEACAERNLIVTFIQRQVDYRQSHWMVDAPDLQLDDIADLCAEIPEMTVIILNGLGYKGSRLLTDAENLPDNYSIEMSRTSAFINKEFEALVNTLSADRVLFGTGSPMKSPGPVLLKMDNLSAPQDAIRKIYGENLAGLLDVS